MAQQEFFVKGDARQKISSAGLIIGFALLTISGIWRLFVGFDNIQTGHRVFGEYAVQLQACALLLTFGFWAASVGMGEIHRSIVARGASWARLRLYFLTIGMSLDITYPAANRVLEVLVVGDPAYRRVRPVVGRALPMTRAA